MNKFERALILSLCFCLFLIVGCVNLQKEDRFYEYKVPDEKLHTLDALTLTEKKVSDPNAVLIEAVEPNAAAAPQELKLSLEECRSESLKNNLDLQTQLISPSISQAGLDAESAKFESTFYSMAGLSRTDTPGQLVKVDDGTYIPSPGSQFENTDAAMGVKMPMQTGGTLDFNLADYRTHNLAINPFYESGFNFSISQPLLKNAGQRVNTHSIRLARYDKQITDNAVKLEVIRVLAASDRSYWRLYAARKELEVQQQQHELAKAQLERAKRLVNVGQQAGVEVLRAEAGLSRQLAAIIVAENELRSRQREFKRMINKPGIDIQTATIMIPSTEPDPVLYDLDRTRMIEQAEKNRAELLELELQIAANISQIDYLNNQMLPLVTLDYNYHVSGTGMTQDDSYDMLNEKNYENHRVGVSLWVPLGNEAAKNRLRQALYQKRQRLSSKESRKQYIKQEVLDAIDKVDTSWQQILASRQSTILEGRLYEAEIRQFEQGLRTSTDVLDAQARLARAQSAEIKSLADYQISLVDLAYATGTLLGADKVQWEPVKPIVGME